ncbi:hypothetical protein GTW43_17665, partial [Streptomyces sp. SID5785]|uniref:hypothetical protein n=1 Tax=Streptomyces sp. SID5785 TaxID=2690309 RepID=UPI0013610B99
QLLAEPEHAEPVLVEALTDACPPQDAAALDAALSRARALRPRPELVALHDAFRQRHGIADGPDPGRVDPVAALSGAAVALDAGDRGAARDLLRQAGT